MAVTIKLSLLFLLCLSDVSSLKINTRGDPQAGMVWMGLISKVNGKKFNNMVSLINMCAQRGCKILLGTKDDQIEKWGHNLTSIKPGVVFIETDPTENKGNHRTQRLAAVRNHLLTRLRTDPQLKDAKTIAIADMDGVIRFENKTMQRIDRALSLPGWGGLSFASKNYYDLFALRCTDDTKNCFIKDLHGHCGVCPCLKDHRKECVKKALNMAKTDPDALLPIQGAFGGLALYKTEAIEGCWYDGDGEDKANHAMECEHVPFNQCVRKKGKPFMLAGMDVTNYWAGFCRS